METKNNFNLLPWQRDMATEWATKGRLFNTSDPGTGKTIGTIAGYCATPAKKRMIVLAPLSILEASWLDDIEKYANGTGTPIRCAIAHGKKREAILKDTDIDIVITNHDAVKWIVKEIDQDTLSSFTHVAVDESTAYKNSQAQRSKAARDLITRIPCVTLMTGTPNPRSVLDLWHQAYLLDGGQRLGKKFFAFRASVCNAVIKGPITTWEDKSESIDYAFDKLKDITYRASRDLLELPENQKYTKRLTMPSWVKKKYDELLHTQMLESEGIEAVNAASKVMKLLQLLSGALYDNEGNVKKVHLERYELITELVLERQHSVVAFNWQHQREALTSLATKAKIEHELIDGSVPAKRRAEIVKEFQAGNLQAVYAHPQSAGHGLTLTRGQATIWASPTYNTEHWEQFNARIWRNGQKHKTETIRIAYKDSIEEDVYEKLDGKIANMNTLLNLMRA